MKILSKKQVEEYKQSDWMENYRLLGNNEYILNFESLGYKHTYTGYFGEYNVITGGKLVVDSRVFFNTESIYEISTDLSNISIILDNSKLEKYLQERKEPCSLTYMNIFCEQYLDYASYLKFLDIIVKYTKVINSVSLLRLPLRYYAILKDKSVKFKQIGNIYIDNESFCFLLDNSVSLRQENYMKEILFNCRHTTVKLCESMLSSLIQTDFMKNVTLGGGCKISGNFGRTNTTSFLDREEVKQYLRLEEMYSKYFDDFSLIY